MFGVYVCVCEYLYVWCVCVWCVWMCVWFLTTSSGHFTWLRWYGSLMGDVQFCLGVWGVHECVNVCEGYLHATPRLGVNTVLPVV